jgi:hypothetical protein
MSGVSTTGRRWRIRPGDLLTAAEGELVERVVVTSVTPTTFTALVTKAHAPGFPIRG